MMRKFVAYTYKLLNFPILLSCRTCSSRLIYELLSPYSKFGLSVVKNANFAKHGRPNSVTMTTSMLTYTQGNVKMFSHKV